MSSESVSIRWKIIYVLMYRHWSNSRKEEKFIHLSFNLLVVCFIDDWSFNSFVDVHVDCVDIDQRFQNRECLAFDHEIDRVINVVYSFHLCDLSSLVWLSQAHDVNHETFLLNRIELNETVVQWFEISA
jgi:hypothetical protein